MALLPFDDWIYGLTEKKEELNKLHIDAQRLQASILDKANRMQKEVDLFNEFIANNELLVIIHTMTIESDKKLEELVLSIKMLPEEAKGSFVFKTAAGVAEFIGGAFVLKGIGQLTKIGLNRYASRIAPLAEKASLQAERLGFRAAAGQLARLEWNAAFAEGIFSKVPVRSLLKTGMGIAVAVGLDAIFGAINGAKTKEQLVGYIKKLKHTHDNLNQFNRELEAKMKDLNEAACAQMKVFQNVCAEMFAVCPHIPQFQYEFDCTPANFPHFIKAQKQALESFSVLMKLRDTYNKAYKRNPNVTREQVIGVVSMTCEPEITDEMLVGIWNRVLSKYSDAMRTARTRQE